MNSFMLFSYKQFKFTDQSLNLHPFQPSMLRKGHSRKSSSISGTMVWNIFCRREANISDNCLKWECSSQFVFLLVDLCSQNIQNNSLIATLKYTVDNCAKTNPEKDKVNQGKWLFRDFLVIYEWMPICSVFEYSVLVGKIHSIIPFTCMTPIWFLLPILLLEKLMNFCRERVERI